MTEVWGMLAKSQTDPQTVDEAITASINDHLADPDAHLGVSESLQSHKAAAIIDHVVGSVVADKMSHQEGIYLTTFESLDRWVLTGSEYAQTWPGFVLWCDGSAPVLSSLHSDLFGPVEFLDYSKNMLFQSVFWIVETSTKLVVCGYAVMSGESIIQGFGFKIEDATLKAYFYNGTTLEESTITGIDIYSQNVYRAQWDKNTEECYFYVNGVLKATIVPSAVPGVEDGRILFYIKSKTTAEAYLAVRNCMLSRDP